MDPSPFLLLTRRRRRQPHEGRRPGIRPPEEIVRTCQKHGRNFLNYGLELIGLAEPDRPLPFGIAPTPVAAANSS